jgi:uncharacterized protein (DUF934 family)
MSLLKNGRLVDDGYVAVADDAPLPANGAPLVSLTRWQRERDALRARNGSVGVRLPNAVAVEVIADDLDRLDVIALEFPKFNDGRAFSQARQLRERHGFRGELRATGQVLRDQLLFMTRCGFDAFEIAKGDPAAAWQRALAEFTVFYQPTGDGRTPAGALRGRRHAEAAD